MGFVRQKKVFRLQFEDPEMKGLEVRARSVALGVFLDLMELYALLMDLDTSNISAEDMRRLDRLFEGFADALIDWNLEDEDEQGNRTPVPATFEALKAQETEFALQVVKAWIEALYKVPDFLSNGQSDGGRSLEESMPMEASSPSPPS